MKALAASFSFSLGQRKALSPQLSAMTAIMFRGADDMCRHLRTLHQNSKTVGHMVMMVMMNIKKEWRWTSRKRARSWCWERESRNSEGTIEDFRKGVQEPVQDFVLVRACER